MKLGSRVHDSGEIVKSNTGGGEPVTISSMTYRSEVMNASPLNSASTLNLKPLLFSKLETLNTAVAKPAFITESDFSIDTYFPLGKIFHLTESPLPTRLPERSFVLSVSVIC